MTANGAMSTIDLTRTTLSCLARTINKEVLKDHSEGGLKHLLIGRVDLIRDDQAENRRRLVPGRRCHDKHYEQRQ